MNEKQYCLFPLPEGSPGPPQQSHERQQAFCSIFFFKPEIYAGDSPLHLLRGSTPDDQRGSFIRSETETVAAHCPLGASVWLSLSATPRTSEPKLRLTQPLLQVSCPRKTTPIASRHDWPGFPVLMASLRKSGHKVRATVPVALTGSFPAYLGSGLLLLAPGVALT